MKQHLGQSGKGLLAGCVAQVYLRQEQLAYWYRRPAGTQIRIEAMKNTEVAIFQQGQSIQAACP